MNRHERRARAAQGGAQEDKGFKEFRAQAKRTFATMTDRDIGAAWMRGQALNASDVDAMVIHKLGETAVRHDNDIRVSLGYGALKFKAVIASELLREAIGGWQKCVTGGIAECERQNGRRHEPREMTRMAILKELIETNHVHGGAAAVLTAATGWLVATGPVGELLKSGAVDAVHYEIIDIRDRDGRLGHNFRLVLNHDDTPLEDWIKDRPSPFDVTPAGER